MITKKQDPIRGNKIFLSIANEKILAFRNLKMLCIYFKKEKNKFSYFTLRDKFQDTDTDVVEYQSIKVQRVSLQEDDEA
jgi:hypothetical protein